MCCDGWNIDVEPGDVEGECPDCGGETVNGVAKTGCNYSPCDCQTCESHSCDQSC